MDETDLLIEVVRECPPEPHMCVHTNCGVRVTDIPTGISAQCASERSQMANKRLAIEELKRLLAAAGHSVP